jgi:hypothetical protein
MEDMGPGPVECEVCSRQVNDWVWDVESAEWEPDFEWWHHPPSGHQYLCCRDCWLKVHRFFCGKGNACRTEEPDGTENVPLQPVPATEPVPEPS